MSNVHVVSHPLVQHKLTLMRDKTVSTKGFRQLLNEIGMLLAYEVTRDLPLEMVEVETPLAKTMQPTIAGKKLVFAPILRAGVGFLDGMLNLVPSARVAHIGLYRDPQTLEAVEYYFKAPVDVAERLVIVMDPMLATANSAVAAIDRLKRRGVKDIRFVCLLAAPEGIERLTTAHPDVEIWTAAIDEKLNEHGYIVPGLGRRGRPHVRDQISGRDRSGRRRTSAPRRLARELAPKARRRRSKPHRLSQRTIGVRTPRARLRRASGPPSHTSIGASPDYLRRRRCWPRPICLARAERALA